MKYNPEDNFVFGKAKALLSIFDSVCKKSSIAEELGVVEFKIHEPSSTLQEHHESKSSPAKSVVSQPGNKEHPNSKAVKEDAKTRTSENEKKPPTPDRTRTKLGTPNQSGSESHSTPSQSTKAESQGSAKRKFATYVAAENETPRLIAKKLGLEPEHIVNLNKGRYDGIVCNSKFRKGTMVRVPASASVLLEAKPQASSGSAPGTPTMRATRTSTVQHPISGGTPSRRSVSPLATGPSPQNRGTSPAQRSDRSQGRERSTGSDVEQPVGKAAQKVVESPVARTVISNTRMVEAAVSKIEKHQSGNTLKISGPLPPESLSEIFKALEKNRSTQRLDLEGCQIGDQGCQILSKVILKNKGIQEIDLQFNQITDEGANDISKGLVKSGVTELHLGNNDMSVLGTTALLMAAEAQFKASGTQVHFLGLPTE